MPLRLTSQYELGVMEADEAAVDAEGLDWYRDSGRGDADALTDEDVPTWPLCVACGLGVDWLHDPHWHHNDDPDGHLWAHDAPQCVR